MVNMFGSHHPAGPATAFSKPELKLIARLPGDQVWTGGGLDPYHKRLLCFGGHVAVVDLPAGRTEKNFALPEMAAGFKAVAGGREYLWIGGDGQIFATDANTFVTRLVQKGGGRPRAFDSTNDGNKIYYGSDSGLRCFDRVSKSVAEVGKRGSALGVFDVAVSSTGKLVATGQYTVSEFRLGPNLVRRTLKGPGDGGWIQDLAFSPNEQYLACGTLDGYVEVWQTTTGKLLMSTRVKKSIASVKWVGDYLEASAFAREKLGQRGNAVLVFKPLNPKPFRIAVLPDEAIVFSDWISASSMVLLYEDGRIATFDFSL